MKNVSELIHGFLNGLIKKEIIKGNWYADEEVLIYRRTEVAKFIVFNKKKLLFLNRSFDASGAYGNGYSYYFIAKSCPSHYINVEHIPSLELLNNKEERISWYLRELKSRNINLINHLANLKSAADFNNRVQYCYTPTLNFSDLMGMYNNDYILSAKLLKIPLKVFNKDFTLSGQVLKYRGWSKVIYGEKYYFTLPLKKWFDFSLDDLFSEKEIDIIDFKNWRNAYLKYYNKRTGKNYFLHDKNTSWEIYKNPERKLRVEENKKLREEEQRQAELKREEEQKLKEKESLWKNIKHFRNTGKRFHSSALSYNLLHYKNNIVTTNLGVTISTEEAKKALKIFRSYIEGNKEKVRAIIKGASVKGFIVKEIITMNFEKCIGENDFGNIEAPTIIIGCHKIPWFEVEEFLNYYKLDW